MIPESVESLPGIKNDFLFYFEHDISTKTIDEKSMSEWETSLFSSLLEKIKSAIMMLYDCLIEK
jgi:hypothetical protein